MLSQERAQRSAGHDDRTLGAEGAAAAMAIPEDRGLRNATLSDILLLPNRIASMASGMP